MDGKEFLKAMLVVLNDTAGDQFMEEIKAGKADWEDVVKKALEERAEGWEEHEERFVTRYRTVYIPPTGDLRHQIPRLSDTKQYVSACSVLEDEALPL
jgi:hypothetical protein